MEQLLLNRHTLSIKISNPGSNDEFKSVRGFTVSTLNVTGKQIAVSQLTGFYHSAVKRAELLLTPIQRSKWKTPDAKGCKTHSPIYMTP